MLIFAFFKWWYGSGWWLQFKNLERRVGGYVNTFSLPILLRTLFAPWKQIVSYTRNQSVGNKLRGFLDNLVSRFVGFWVRVFVIITGFVVIIAIAAINILIIIGWPLLPLALIALTLISLGIF